MIVLRRAAALTSTFLAINIGLFALQVLSGVDPLRPSTLDLLRWGGNAAVLTFNGQPWRLLSSMFLHIGLVHLVFNMYMLASWGPFVERYFGRWRFAALYLGAGLCGSVFSALWALRPPTQLLVSAGASGALMGLAGACLAVRLLSEKGFRISPLLGPSTQTLATLIGVNILFGFIYPGVDNACHIGGLLGGAVFGVLLASRGRTGRSSSA